MNRLRKPWTSCALVVVAVILAAAVPAYAQRPAGPQILPHYTLGVIRIADVPLLAERFQQTAMGRVGQDPQMKPLVGQVYKAGQDAFKPIENAIGLPLDQLLKIPQGEVCVGFVGPPDLDQNPGVVVVIDTKDQVEQARKLLTAIEQIAFRNGGSRGTEKLAGEEVIVLNGLPPGKIFCIEHDGTFVFATTKPIMETVVANLIGTGLERPLAEVEKYNTTMNRCFGQGDEPPQISWFVDPIAIIRRQATGWLSAGLALFPALGLDGLEAVGGTITFSTGEFDEVQHFHVLLNNPRAGVIDAIGLSSGDMSPESWVPGDCVSYSTIHWDLRHTLNRTTKLFNEIMGDGAAQQWLKQRISDPLGADVEKEIVPQLTGRGTWVQWVEKPVKINGIATLGGLQLKDPKAAAAVLDKLTQKRAGFLERQRYGTVEYWSSKNPVQPRQQRAGGGPFARQPLPCFGIINDYLVFTDSMQAFQEAVTSQANPEQSLATSLDFKLIASKIRRQPGGDAPGAIQFNRPEEGLRFWYDLVNAESTRKRLSEQGERNPFLGGVNQALKDHPLPPFDTLAQYMAPGGGVIINDDTGIHYTTFTLKRK